MAFFFLSNFIRWSTSAPMMQLTEKNLSPLPPAESFEINICQEGIYYFHMLECIIKLTFCANEQFISVPFFLLWIGRKFQPNPAWVERLHNSLHVCHETRFLVIYLYFLHFLMPYWKWYWWISMSKIVIACFNGPVSLFHISHSPCLPLHHYCASQQIRSWQIDLLEINHVLWGYCCSLLILRSM